MRIAGGAAVVIAVLLLGTLGTHLFYGAPWLVAVYWTLSLITAVGDTRLSPHTPAQTVFSGVLLIVGAALWIYWLSVVVSWFVAFDQSRKEHRLMDSLARLRGHIVILGAGGVGLNVARELIQGGETVVVADTDANRIAAVEDPTILTVTLQAYDLDHFRSLNLQTARGLALALPDDAQNLFAYLTAQDLNPNLRVVARARTQESAHHFRQLGVHQVVMPDAAGGQRMGRMLLKPRAHQLMMALLEQDGVRLHEVDLGPTDRMVGQPVSEVRSKFGATYTLLGYWRDGRAHLAPAAQELLAAGDVLVLLQQTSNEETYGINPAGEPTPAL